jgi:hypothetical protein
LIYNIDVNEPRCIRYFNSKEGAAVACTLLREEGFECEMKEQKIGSVTIDKYGLPLKYKLYVERGEINKIAKILAEKMSESRLK